MLDLAALTTVLNQAFAPVISDQLNSRVTLLRLLRKTLGDGKNIAWDTKLASNHNAGSYADGATIAGGSGTTTRVPAILQWKLNKADFSVSGLTMAVARGSSPDELSTIFEEEIMAAARDLMVALNAQLFGDGTGNGGLDLDGLQAIIANTGSYAGISRATYEKWRGSAYANGAVNRSLSKALLDIAERDVFTASGMQPDVIITTPALVTTYENLFDSIKRQDAKDATYDIGSKSVAYKGIPIVRDINCPAGHLYMMSMECCELIQLQPEAVADGVNVLAGKEPLRDPEGNLGIQVAVELLGRTGDKVDGYLKLYSNLRCRHPNRCAVIKDLA